MAQAKERAVWERIVAEVEAGMSQRAAAQRYGVSAAGVEHWVRRLRQERASHPAPQLLPVRVTSASPPQTRCALVGGDLGVGHGPHSTRVVLARSRRQRPSPSERGEMLPYPAAPRYCRGGRRKRFHAFTA